MCWLGVLGAVREACRPLSSNAYMRIADTGDLSSEQVSIFMGDLRSKHYRLICMSRNMAEAGNSGRLRESCPILSVVSHTESLRTA